MMDHTNQLDSEVYNISHEKHGSITMKIVKHQNNPEPLALVTQKHNIVDTMTCNKYKTRNDCVVFGVHCEYTGLHYHSIKIFVNVNDKRTRTKHSAHGDGSLCYRNYEPFLVAKIKYFEKTMSDIPIYIHESILLTPKEFHDDGACDDW